MIAKVHTKTFVSIILNCKSHPPLIKESRVRCPTKNEAIMGKGSERVCVCATIANERKVNLIKMAIQNGYPINRLHVE